MKLKRRLLSFRNLSGHSQVALSVSGLAIIAVIAVASWQVKHPAPVVRPAPDQTIAELTPNAQTASADKKELVKRYLLFCETQPCIWQGAQVITAKYGPQVALDSLDYYKLSYPDKAIGDSHEWAHVVGRQTAATYGMTGQAFLKCPTTFNYGCQHGFFEKVLGHANSPKEAIDQICGELQNSPNYSPKFKFYCYHGVGHGVMQSQDYNLMASLAVCDSLDSTTAQDGCWQGVFMENINGEANGKGQPGIFLADDPLAPCDKVADKYQHECYINHSAHLMLVYDHDVGLGSRACLMAAQTQVTTCLEAIGLMVTNDTWEPSLRPLGSGSIEQRGWQLCQQFPGGYVASCVDGGVDHILQMDELNTARANIFCQMVESYQSECYRRLGVAIKNQTTSQEEAYKICSDLSNSAKEACMQGATS